MPSSQLPETTDSAEPAGLDAMMSASKVITAAVALSLASVDSSVTLPQLRVLVMLSSRGPLNLTAVAEGLGVNASNASRACDRLVAAGLVTRREDPSDRRQVSLSLTRQGTRTIDAVLRHRRTVLGQVVSRMSPADQRRLAEGLQAFNDTAAGLSDVGELSDGEGHLLRWLT